VVVYAAATAAVWIIYDSQQYLTITTLIVGALLILGMLGVIAVLFAGRTNGRGRTGSARTRCWHRSAGRPAEDLGASPAYNGRPTC
jgi:hypothetical protein